MPNASAGDDNDGGGRNKEEMKLELCPSYGVVSVMGERDEIEDAVAAVPSFCMGLHFFGVYDGHGGAEAAGFCRERLHLALAAELREQRRRDCGDRLWVNAMKKCFEKMDVELGGQCSTGKCGGDDGNREICCRELAAPVNVGATAVVAVVGEGEIVVGNCGDCRAVLCRGGKAVPLSNDHKPEREDEMDRIKSAGGRIILWNGYRVGGLLSISRALGDRYLKQYVISEPEVTFAERREDDEFLILASDGLWDVVSNEVACKAVTKCFAGDQPPHSSHATATAAATPSSAAASASAAALLTKIALARGSKDNVTVIVIDLKQRTNPIPVYSSGEHLCCPTHSYLEGVLVAVKDLSSISEAILQTQ